MNKSTPSGSSPAGICFGHFISLRYLLAGDLDSMKPLDELEQRLLVINWNDPEFVRFTEEMRIGVPKPAVDQEASLLSILYSQNEALGRGTEIGADMAAFLRALAKSIEEYRVLICTLFDLHKKMLSHLELLGADTSPYMLPEQPLP